MSADAGLVERLEAAAAREPLLLSDPPQNTAACKLYTEAAQRIRELEAKLAAAHKALEPFVAVHDALNNLSDIRPNGDEDEGYNVPVSGWSDAMPVTVTLGSIRRAAAIRAGAPR